jgi:hypothetical protein
MNLNIKHYLVNNTPLQQYCDNSSVKSHNSKHRNESEVNLVQSGDENKAIEGNSTDKWNSNRPKNNSKESKITTITSSWTNNWEMWS